MHTLLTKLLKGRGIDNPVKLDKEEKATFDQWALILNKEELTVEDIKKYCQSQLSIIENKWADYEKDNDKKAQLIPYYTVYKILLNVIQSPKVAREALEQQLNQLI